MNDEFIAVPKGLFIYNLNYVDTSPTGATPKSDVDRLVNALKQCRPVKINAPAPTPPDGGEPVQIKPAEAPTPAQRAAVKDAPKVVGVE